MLEKRGIPGFIIIFFVLVSLVNTDPVFAQKELRAPGNIICGAERTGSYLGLLEGKKIGLVGNPSSMIGDKHLLDSLISLGIKVQRVFCPEHGFRGKGEAGEKLVDHRDPVTGIQVISLYGNNMSADPGDLEDIDLIIFDIQDVGARFYTYISTLHYVMEAAAQNSIPVIILDRPNPNGFYVDGPIREDKFVSFVGLHPVPVVHGMTIGEYGKMINGEGWLENSVQCDLKIIPCLNYDHLCSYLLPVKPSPNLPNEQSVILYPSLCFFEGTVVSIGRGTGLPFQIFGHPDLDGDFHFRPVSTPGASLNPKLEGELCKGFDLRSVGVDRVITERRLILEWIVTAFQNLGSTPDFYTSYFDKLIGNSWVREDIINGIPVDTIRVKWADDVIRFKETRKKYLLYPDFE